MDLNILLRFSIIAKKCMFLNDKAVFIVKDILHTYIHNNKN